MLLPEIFLALCWVEFGYLTQNSNSNIGSCNPLLLRGLFPLVAFGYLNPQFICVCIGIFPTSIHLGFNHFYFSVGPGSSIGSAAKNGTRAGHHPPGRLGRCHGLRRALCRRRRRLGCEGSEVKPKASPHQLLWFPFFFWSCRFFFFFFSWGFLGFLGVSWGFFTCPDFVLGV